MLACTPRMINKLTFALALGERWIKGNASSAFTAFEQCPKNDQIRTYLQASGGLTDCMEPLVRFWSSQTSTIYLCSRVLQVSPPLAFPLLHGLKWT